MRYCTKVLSGVIAGLLFTSVVSARAVFAAEENKNVKGPAVVTSQKMTGENKNVKEPTVITAQKMTTDQKAQTALFEGNVVSKKGDRTMYADQMLVHYSEEKGSSNIKQIDAEGNVKLIRGDRVVTSKFAVYHSEPEEYIVFTGEPRASQGENVVTGTKITYFMKDDHSIVENSKVFIVNKDRQQSR
ncbi:MAG TPA: LptA/OstA family protein [Dissulfurispiraceae bacterium]|nr:LptA/OstA family protein [Dissulfurispiraceae bacterium]